MANIETVEYFLGGRDLQIMMDVLRSKNGMIGTQKSDYSVQDTPVYFSNVSDGQILIVL